MTRIRIGLTGGMGAGKSTVGALLAACGATVVEADDLARQVVAPGTPALAAIVDRWGPSVLQADGTLDRAALAAIVFADPEERRALEAITHPAIIAESERILAASPALVGVHVAALLIEAGTWQRYDALWLVTAPEEVRIARVVARDGVDPEAVRARIASQLPDSEKAKLAQVMIDTDCSREVLAERVQTQYASLVATHAVPLLEQPITDRASLSRFFTEVAPWQKMKWGTERVERLLALLGHPERGMNFVIVGGTNAKGSTALYLTALLQAAGLRVGVNISPHISDIRERVQVGGALISWEALIAAVETMRQALLRWPADAPELPTYHELWTVAALVAFAQQQVELAVMEVGMGGRYDAARAVPAQVSILTPISFDHMKFLGDTLTAIAIEKVEIIAEGGLVITAPQRLEAEAVILAKTRIARATWHSLDTAAQWTLTPDATPLAPTFDFQRDDWSLANLTPGLRGRYQAQNAAVAVLALKAMHETGRIASLPDEAAIRGALQGVTQAQHPARFEQLCLEPPVWCEGGHNPQALEVFIDDWLAVPHRPRLHLLIGFKRDKDVQGALAELRRLNPVSIICTQSEQLETIPAAEIAALLDSPEWSGVVISVEPKLDDALTQWAASLAADPAGEGLLIGSLYLAGDVRNRLSAGKVPGLPWHLAPPATIPDPPRS